MENLKPGDHVFVIRRESAMYEKTAKVVQNLGAGVLVKFPDSGQLWYFERKWLQKLIY